MANVAEGQIEALALLCVPRSSSLQWDPSAAKVGLQQLRRLRGEIASLEAVLVGVLKTETGHDTKAALVRGFGMSNAEAVKALTVSDIVARVPGAGDALADGSVSGEHMVHLKPIVDNNEAAELLALAPSKSPDEFRRAVQKYMIDRDAKGVVERQKKARSVKFFKADDGCVGMRVILPTLQGEQLKAAITNACDAAWRAAHPDRAETVGGHEDDTLEQRLADALVAVVNGTAVGGSARTALIVTMQAETLECNILGVGPIPTRDALTLVDDPRTDVYAAIQATDGAIMKFGRSRRFASPLQKLALALRDGGFCAKAGCEQPWNRCDADHVDEWDSGGLTDIEDLRLLCRCGCHKHRHETGQDLSRQSDGTWSVDDETFPPWPPPPVPPAPKPRSLEADHGFRQICRKLGRPDPYPELAA
jgi:hypothetical protein